MPQAKKGRTQGPWKIHRSGSEGYYYLFPDSGNKREDLNYIAIVKGRDLLVDQANAEFIVRAVNNHDALLAACKAVSAAADDEIRIDLKHITEAIKQVRAAIQKIEATDAA